MSYAVNVSLADEGTNNFPFAATGSGARSNCNFVCEVGQAGAALGNCRVHCKCNSVGKACGDTAPRPGPNRHCGQSLASAQSVSHKRKIENARIRETVSRRSLNGKIDLTHVEHVDLLFGARLRATLAAKPAWLLLTTALRATLAAKSAWLLLTTPLWTALAAEHTAHISRFILVDKSIFVLIHSVK